MDSIGVFLDFFVFWIEKNNLEIFASDESDRNVLNHQHCWSMKYCDFLIWLQLNAKEINSSTSSSSISCLNCLIWLIFSKFRNSANINVQIVIFLTPRINSGYGVNEIGIICRYYVLLRYIVRLVLSITIFQIFDEIVSHFHAIWPNKLI